MPRGEHKPTTGGQTTASSRRRDIPILVADLTIVLVGNAIPGPLLPAYTTAWSLTPLSVTLIFAIYAVGVISAIVLAGKIADQIGARPAIVAALLFSACGSLVALAAPAIAWMYLARIIQGVAAALVGGAATAAITQASDNPDAGARWTTIGTTGGIALGLLIAGAVGQTMSNELTSIWIVYLVLLAAAGLATASLRGALSLAQRPRLSITRPGLPEREVPAFLRAIAAASLAFACMGLLAGLGPSLALAIGLHSVLGEAAVAALAYIVSGAVVLTVGGRVNSSVPGLIVLLIGLIPMLVAASSASAGWLLTGAGIIGLGNGMTFRITLANVNHLAPSRRRAEIVSTYNIAMYSGIVAALIATAVLADASSLPSAATLVTAAIGAGVIVLVVCEHTAGRGRRTRSVVDNRTTPKERP